MPPTSFRSPSRAPPARSKSWSPAPSPWPFQVWAAASSSRMPPAASSWITAMVRRPNRAMSCAFPASPKRAPTHPSLQARLLSRSAPPRCRPPAPSPLIALCRAAEDSQRVEVSGIVRAAQISETESNLDLAIASGGYRFHAFPKIPPGMDPESLIGARVRLRGTSGAFFNQVQRRLTALKLFMPLPEDFMVESRESIDPFTEPLLALNNIAQYRRDNRPGQRVHVKGTITFQRPGQELFLQDASGGLRVQSRQLEPVSVGDVVEAAGFPDIETLSSCRMPFSARPPNPDLPSRPGPSPCKRCRTVCAMPLWSHCRVSCSIASCGATARPPVAICACERS